MKELSLANLDLSQFPGFVSFFPFPFSLILSHILLSPPFFSQRPSSMTKKSRNTAPNSKPSTSTITTSVLSQVSPLFYSAPIPTQKLITLLLFPLSPPTQKQTKTNNKKDNFVIKCSFLRCLSISNNELHFLPSALGGFTNLTRLYANYNTIESLPPSLAHLAGLAELFLSWNQLKEISAPLLPPLQNLQSLDLTGNQMSGNNNES